MKKLNIDLPWTKLLVEFVSVVFAIFFALVVDQWKDDRDNQRMAEKALSNIEAEVQKNYDSLLVYHQNYSQRIQAIDSLINLAKNDKPFNLKGYQFMTLTSTAWESAKLTQVLNFMDFESVGEISEVYNAQVLYTNVVQKIIDDMIFTANINTLAEAAILLQKHKHFFISINMLESQLLESYKKFLEKQNTMTK